MIERPVACLLNLAETRFNTMKTAVSEVSESPYESDEFYAVALRVNDAEERAAALYKKSFNVLEKAVKTTPLTNIDYVVFNLCKILAESDSLPSVKLLKTAFKNYGLKLLSAKEVSVEELFGCEKPMTNDLEIARTIADGMLLIEDYVKLTKSFDVTYSDFKHEITEFITSNARHQLMMLSGKLLDLAETGKFQDQIIVDPEEIKEEVRLCLLEIYTGEEGGSLDENIWIGDSAQKAVEIEKMNEELRPVTRTRIPTFDKFVGPVYTTHVLEVQAAPNAGKTTAATNLGYNGMADYGSKVFFATLEQRIPEVFYKVRARHLKEVHNFAVPRMSDVPEELKAQVQEILDIASVEISKGFDNGGQLCIFDGALNIETFVDDLTYIKKHLFDFDLIIIDYMTLITSTSGMTASDTAALAYIQFKQFCRKYNVGGVSLNQFTREAVEASYGKNANLAPSSGAKTAESERTPDAIMKIITNNTLDVLNQRDILNPKNRHGQKAPKVRTDVDFAASMFFEDQDILEEVI